MTATSASRVASTPSSVRREAIHRIDATPCAEPSSSNVPIRSVTSSARPSRSPLPRSVRPVSGGAQPLDATAPVAATLAATAAAAAASASTLRTDPATDSNAVASSA